MLCNLFVFFLLLIASTAFAGGVDSSLIREEKTVVVNGVTETWRLVWEGKTTLVCDPKEDGVDALNCPCSGLAYGERGKLALVRMQGGKEIERMDLNPLFGTADYVETDRNPSTTFDLQRWPVYDDDFSRLGKDDPNIVADIKSRPLADIMKFEDYNRDGWATEFTIMVETAACGHTYFAVVGVSVKDPRLHAFESVLLPNRPLVMQEKVWEALLEGEGPHTVSTWRCGDHGSRLDEYKIVAAKNGDIRVLDEVINCQE